MALVCDKLLLTSITEGKKTVLFCRFILLLFCSVNVFKVRAKATMTQWMDAQ